MTYHSLRTLLLLPLSIGITILWVITFLWIRWGEWTEFSAVVLLFGILAIATSIQSILTLRRKEKDELFENEVVQIHLFKAREKSLSRVDELELATARIHQPESENPYSLSLDGNNLPTFIAELLEVIYQDINRLLVLGDIETAEDISKKVREVLRGTPWSGDWAYLLGKASTKDELL